MTDQDREFNGRMIEELCKLGEAVLQSYMRGGESLGTGAADGSIPSPSLGACTAKPALQTPAEQCGMTETQYRHAEALHLYGDLSGIER